MSLILRENQSKTPLFHVFGLLYTNPSLFMSRMNELLYINKLPGPERESKLHRINLLREKKFVFDITFLQDLREEQVLETMGDKVTPLANQAGRIMLTNSRIYFQPFSNISNKPVKKYNLADITRVVKRRFLLRQIGLELLIKNNSTVFFAFENKDLRDRLYDMIMEQQGNEYEYENNYKDD